MTFQVIHSLDGGNARSPFRIIEQPGREVDWINRFPRSRVCAPSREKHSTQLRLGPAALPALVGKPEPYRCRHRKCA